MDSVHNNPTPVQAALLIADPKVLRAALVDAKLPETMDGKTLVYWLQGRMPILRTERPDAMEVLEVVLAAGADPNAIGDRHAKMTALMEASAQADLPAMRRLLAAGADPVARTAMGTTALHWAAAAGTLAGVRLLLEHDVPVDILNNDGESPLHWAARRLHRPVIREFYHRGANFEQLSTPRLTPLDVIAKRDPRLAEFWRHKPGRDRMEQVTAPAPNQSGRRGPRL